MSLPGEMDGARATVPQSGALAAIRASLDAERPRFFLWAPVWLGVGIAAYFALPLEPQLITALAPAALFICLLMALSRGTLSASLAIGLLLSGVGFLSAKLRVEAVRAPVLQKQINNADLIGRVERVEPKMPRGERITLWVEELAGLAEAERPVRVRVRTLKTHNAPDSTDVKPGMRVRLKATLSPPARPAIPGGFDFARAAWFERLGGVGYTYAPVEILPGSPGPGWPARYAEIVEDIRAGLNARIKAVLPGETGAIATALITGERGGISEATNNAYRNAGLFHILSISGLHMVIMAGAVFFCVRLLLAALPGIALRFSIKKWAALTGIIGALAYLAISGGAFATVRSAVQIVIMFLAILLDRPALALRNVALAAFIILLLFPESLFDAGFQMSFAAVAGLVGAYEGVRSRFANPSEPHPVLRVVMFFGGIVLSTLVASFAVAPFAAYHFHQSQQYAVLANLLAIPICNFAVMPAALAALILMPLGLEAVALVPMGVGIDAMTWCAGLVAKLPGAVAHLPAIPTPAFVLIVAGGLWVILWRGRVRVIGAALAIAGLLLAPHMPRPDVLIARGGELVAVRGPDGSLSALPARQSKFELGRWLEHDGDGRSPRDAVNAHGFTCDSIGCVARLKGARLAVARHPAAIGEDCARADIVVLNVPRPKRGCAAQGTVIDFFDVWRNGTHALYLEPGGGEASSPAKFESLTAQGVLRIDTVARHRGDRPWSQMRAARPPMPRIKLEETGGPDAEVAKGKAAPSRHASPRRLPQYTRKPEWLAPLPPRPEIEDDDGSEDVEAAAGDSASDADGVEDTGPSQPRTAR